MYCTLRRVDTTYGRNYKQIAGGSKIEKEDRYLISVAVVNTQEECLKKINKKS